MRAVYTGECRSLQSAAWSLCCRPIIPLAASRRAHPSPVRSDPSPCRAKQFREGMNTLAPSMDAGLAMIIKQRPKAGQIERMDLVGSVDGADVVIVDDMIDTAGTLCTAAANLKANGARRVYAFASHGLFSGPASERIARSVLEEVVVTNTIPLKAGAKANEKIVQLSVAPLLAEAVKRVHYKQSISELFREGKKRSEAPAS